jgi:hypothetical protein
MLDALRGRPVLFSVETLATFSTVAPKPRPRKTFAAQAGPGIAGARIGATANLRKSEQIRKVPVYRPGELDYSPARSDAAHGFTLEPRANDAM